MIHFSLSFLKKLSANDGYGATTDSLVQKASRSMLGGILMLACILAFAPLYPNLPDASFDSSWMLAMNQSVAQGLVFGRDIVFTFGPYAAVYTQAYHSATYFWALFLGLLFGLFYGAMLLMNLRKQGNEWLWLYTGFLFLVDSRDALFFSYPLLVMLVACRATMHEISDSRYWVFSPFMRIIYALAIALLGVLPIIKGSFLPLTVMAMVAGLILHWQKGEKAFALFFILLPLLMMILFWNIAGQPITALPDYFRSMSEIISGFAGAMSTSPHVSDMMMRKIGFTGAWLVMNIQVFGMITAYIIVAVLILVSILRGNINSGLHKIILTLYVGLFLFIAFKSGFVRYDAHALSAGSALVLAVLVLNVFGFTRIGLRILVLSVGIFAVFHLGYVGISFKETSIFSIRGLISGDRIGGRLQTAFKQRMDKFKTSMPIPTMIGTTDIYPYDQTFLIASGNNWNSRPVLQSYSVYTPGLARLNEAHLNGPHAPDNIVFRVATIDGRYPSLDDGLSWPTLFSHYAILNKDKHFAYLQRRQVPLESRKTVVIEGNYQLGEQINLPQSEHILFAEIEVSPSWFGRVSLVAFKSAPLYIFVELADGNSKSYRFIPGMARTGFVISPLVTTTEDFVHLANGQLSLLGQNIVKSIRIAQPGDKSYSWERRYYLKVSVLASPPIPIP